MSLQNKNPSSLPGDNFCNDIIRAGSPWDQETGGNDQKYNSSLVFNIDAFQSKTYLWQSLTLHFSSTY